MHLVNEDLRVEGSLSPFVTCSFYTIETISFIHHEICPDQDLVYILWATSFYHYNVFFHYDILVSMLFGLKN